MFSSDRSNVEDFRISNVNGEVLMTMFAQNQVVALNDDYTIRYTKVFERQGRLNTHELNFVDNGRRAIILMNDVHIVSQGDFPSGSHLNSDDEACSAKYDGFFVVDVTRDRWPRVFEWHSVGKIGLNESTFTPKSVCDGWDFM